MENAAGVAVRKAVQELQEEAASLALLQRAATRHPLEQLASCARELTL